MKHYTTTLHNLRTLYHEAHDMLRDKLDFLQDHYLDADDETLSFSQEQIQELKRNLLPHDIDILNKTLITHEDICSTTYVKFQLGNLRRIYKIAKDSQLTNLIRKLYFVADLWSQKDTYQYTLTLKDYAELITDLTPDELITLEELI